MTTLDLEPIKERLDEATPGPWFADDDGGVSTEPHSHTMTSTPITVEEVFPQAVTVNQLTGEVQG